MKKTTLCLFLSLLNLAVSQAQFTGCFAPANWTIHTNNTNGFVFMQTGGMSIQQDTDVQGNGGGTTLDCDTNGPGNVSACITIPATGQVIFDWAWSGGLNSTFDTEPFGYCLDGIPHTLTSNNPPPFGTGAGTDTIQVITGSQLCFVVSSQLANSPSSLATHCSVTNFHASCVTAITEKSKDDYFSFYPNPTSGKLNIYNESKTNSPLKITVYDLAGKTLYLQQNNLSLQINQIDLDFLQSGIYFLEIITTESQTSRLIQVVK